MARHVRGRHLREPYQPPGGMTAGQVILVVALALLLGLLLGAEDIFRTAERQEAGWQRTLAVGLMRPVVGLSDLLFIDAPRNVVDIALGRSTGVRSGPFTLIPVRPPSDPTEVPAPSTSASTGGAPEVTTPPPSEVIPLTTVMPSTTTTTPDDRREVTTSEPLRMLIAGDSMVSQFGPILEARAENGGLVEAELVFEFSSGLSRPDFFDWPARLSQLTREGDSEVVVMMFGGNDAQDVQIDGLWTPFGTAAWIEEYSKRVDGEMRKLTEAGRHVYWVGMPIVSSDSFRDRVSVLNEVYESEAGQYDLVEYIESWSLFAGPDGGYAEYLPDENGDVVDMRQNDGIHLTTAGADRLARHILDRIAAEWRLD